MSEQQLPASRTGAEDESFKVPETVPESIRAALSLLSRSDRRKYALVVGIQMTLSLLDLAGVLLLGLVGALAISAVQGTPAPSPVQAALDRIGMGDASVVTVAAVCTLLAAGLLLLKSFLFILLTRRMYKFLGRRQGLLSRSLTGRLLSQPLLAIERRSSQKSAYALSGGVAVVVTSLLGAFAILVAEAALLLLMGVALFLIDPLTALVAIAFFVLVGFLLQRALRSWSTRIGTEITETQVEGTRYFQEALASFREVFASGRISLFTEAIASPWQKGADARAEQLFTGQLPKSVYDIALVVGGTGLAVWQFATNSAVEAVTVVTLFIAAASRVVPSMLRANTQLLAIRSGVAQAGVLFQIIDQLEQDPTPRMQTVGIDQLRQSMESDYAGFSPQVEVRDASFTFPGQDAPALSAISLLIQPGERIAFVGPTGAGKSTLADLILGIAAPSKGSVTVSELPADEAIARWPGAIGYVPQSVGLINGTVRENIAFGLPSESVLDDHVWLALEKAHLGDMVRSRDGLETWIGERGVRLSGGQRQRLGLARALYSQPKLLVLDEATSALDPLTEDLVHDSIAGLGSSTTVILIAHRYASIRQVDRVLFLQDGLVAAEGPIDEAMASSEGLRHHLQLMGHQQ